MLASGACCLVVVTVNSSTIIYHLSTTFPADGVTLVFLPLKNIRFSWNTGQYMALFTTKFFYIPKQPCGSGPRDLGFESRHFDQKSGNHLCGCRIFYRVGIRKGGTSPQTGVKSVRWTLFSPWENPFVHRRTLYGCGYGRILSDKKLCSDFFPKVAHWATLRITAGGIVGEGLDPSSVSR